tara:strand:+ start:2142 stop:4337 length:2196 start_codon:yes stop_codon:yes gene_type:complete
MSYINKQNTALVRVKLTDVGRELLAKGQLTFNFWTVGDSEIDYDYVRGWKAFDPSNTNVSSGQFLYYEADGTAETNYQQILRPKDNQSEQKSYLLNGVGSAFNNLNSESSVRLIKGVVSNQAEDRGFFSGSTVDTGLVMNSDTRIIKETGTIDLVKFSGQTDTTSYTKGVLHLDTALSATSVNDYIVFKFSNSTLGNTSGDTMTAATINQFYNINYISGTEIKVDRDLPTLNTNSGTIISYYTIPGGNDPADNWYGSNSLTAYWNTGTLSFNSSNDICVENIPVWNMSNIWDENLAGQFKDTVNEYHNHQLFGSEQFIGSKLLLGYKEPESIIIPTSEISNSYMDTYQKGISIIHYTNNTISNFYGEFFHIDEDNDKLLSLDIPVMWHNRTSATEVGTEIGMRFVSDGVEKELENSQHKYYDLIEYSGMSSTSTVPMVVGKVFHNLKIVVIENEELLAAMSYKSNRNFTLPDLSGSLTNCDDSCGGLLAQNETLFLTYYFEATSGATETPLPCQRYTKIQNTNIDPKDVQFRMEGVDLLPYMRKVEKASYDGAGFFADKFYVLAQIIDESVTARPEPNSWKQIDFTSTLITSGASETIDPLLLERQTPESNGFKLTKTLYTGGTDFNLGTFMDLPEGEYYSKMNFGDERLFYGNLRTHIGATIYKTLFSLNIDGSEFADSTNITYDGEEDRYISEVGVLNDSGALVMVGKLSRPIRIANATTATIEVTMDF